MPLVIPDDAGGERMKLLHVKVGDRLTFLLLGEPKPLTTHWVTNPAHSPTPGNTVPCRAKGNEPCHLCHLPERTEYYAPVRVKLTLHDETGQPYLAWKNAILHLPPTAAELFRGALRVGHFMEVTRRRQGIYTPFKIVKCEPMKGECPPAFDVYRAIEDYFFPSHNKSSDTVARTSESSDDAPATIPFRPKTPTATPTVQPATTAPPVQPERKVGNGGGA